MSPPRLTAATRVSALVRLAQAADGFAAILVKGDATSGQIVIATREKGKFSGLFEPLLDVSGSYRWQRCGPVENDDEQAIDAYLSKRRARDPDLWIVELDVADVTRFILTQASTT